MTGVSFLKRLLGGHADEPSQVICQQATLGARMLVVDDSPTIRAVLGKMLGQEGYAVLKACDGHRAIELARSEQPALIFLDVVMPGMNGFTVLRKLRHDPLARDIPIIMISGNQQATEQFYVQRYGADDFMKKPFGRDEICQRIGQLVASGRLTARQPADLHHAPLPMPAGVRDAIPDVAMPDAEHTRPTMPTASDRLLPAVPAAA
ncbi:MAG: response regulator [Rhodanobacter sp.]